MSEILDFPEVEAYLRVTLHCTTKE